MFIEVVGTDSMSTIRKTDIIDYCIYAAGTVPEKTIMVRGAPPTTTRRPWIAALGSW